MTSIRFEDEYLLAFDKPSWWLTHPSDEARHIKENALTFVRDYVGSYVYSVNRLDLQASGILLFAKKPEIVATLQANWQSYQKHYTALVRGEPQGPTGSFDFELSNDNGHKRPAQTHYKILKQYKDCALVDVSIITGRRHQIRRHFSRRMHALIGDRKYGKKKWNDPFQEKYGLDRLFLHSHFFSFVHPITQITHDIHCPLPEILLRVLEGLENE